MPGPLVRPGRRAALLAALAVIGACEAGAPDPPRPEDPPGPATEAPAPGPPLPGTSADRPFAPPEDTVVARWAERIPDGLLVRRGACPFECCLYRTWTSTTAVPLRPEPRVGAAASSGSLPADEPFEADSGFVRVTGIMLVVPTDTVSGFGPGDTLLALDYVGEGFWSLWDGREVRQVSQFWGPVTNLDVADTLGRWAREWWAHGTGSAGQAGWFSPDSVPDLAGIDACG